MDVLVFLGLIALLLVNLWECVVGFRADRRAQRAWDDAQWDCPDGAALKAFALQKEQRDQAQQATARQQWRQRCRATLRW